MYATAARDYMSIVGPPQQTHARVRTHSTRAHTRRYMAVLGLSPPHTHAPHVHAHAQAPALARTRELRHAHERIARRQRMRACRMSRPAGESSRSARRRVGMGGPVPDTIECCYLREPLRPQPPLQCQHHHPLPRLSWLWGSGVHLNQGCGLGTGHSCSTRLRQKPCAETSTLTSSGVDTQASHWMLCSR